MSSQITPTQSRNTHPLAHILHYNIGPTIEIYNKKESLLVIS